jgi:hypothetical protein
LRKLGLAGPRTARVVEVAVDGPLESAATARRRLRAHDVYRAALGQHVIGFGCDPGNRVEGKPGKGDNWQANSPAERTASISLAGMTVGSCEQPRRRPADRALHLATKHRDQQPDKRYANAKRRICGRRVSISFPDLKLAAVREGLALF